jgi:transglutaminase-like putative cysteine protease
METTRYSAGFRIFAFLAVSSTIAAVSWTIRDPLPLAVGVPGLAAGHYYSWRRRNASIRRSLILLLFMVLTAFLGGDILLSGLSDRLLLSRYLIYGLVIGSFDLMRRRNVIASLILGALLLVLVSELALDLWFIVFPLIFTVLALVTVAIGYVEAETNQAVLVGELKWLNVRKSCLGFAMVALLISAIFFLFMPRLASSQVAQARWLPSRLDLSLGGLAMLPSKPGASVAPGILPSLQDRGTRGAGDYVALGYTGSLADAPVMNVRSRISSYWRGMILDEYDGRGWLTSSPQIKLRDRNRREFVFPDYRGTLPGESVYWQAYYLLTDQPNAIFAGYQPGRIYLPETGKIYLEEGTLYRALSAVPYLSPEQLRLDHVVAEDVANLSLPPISERTAVLAESIVQGAPTDCDKAARLEHFLLANYPYDLNVVPLPPDRDAVDYFLFEQQAGYCSHFATAMAVMARHVGLPARVAAGYLPGYIDAMTGAHVVRAGDAHAWVEIHFRRHGWVAFDPTPRPDTAMGFAAGRNWLYFGLEDFTGVTFASALAPLIGSASLGSLSIAGWVKFILPAVGIVAVVLALLVARRRVRTRQEVRNYSILDGESRRAMLKLYHRMVALLARKGLPPRQPHQPPYEYAAAIYAQIPENREAIAWLTGAASSAAYDPNPFDFSTIIEARGRLSALRRALKHRL